MRKVILAAVVMMILSSSILSAGERPDVDGKWNTVEKSVLGDMTGVLTIDSSGDTFTGTWTHGGTTVTIEDGKLDGDSLSWKVSITEPSPMKLVCEMTVDGDTMTGTASAGNYGSFPMTGTRK